VEQPGGRPAVRPDQTAIQASIARHLGAAPDLYHRGVDPNTGTVTLKFHFPAVARERYAAGLAQIRAETGVDVQVDPNPHQGMLADAALSVLPSDLQNLKAPSIHHTEQVVRVQCEGTIVDSAVLEEAALRFHTITGWRLDLILPGQRLAAPAVAAWEPTAATGWMELNAARNLVVERFGPDTGCYKVGADQQSSTLILRFHFPDVARRRYAAELAQLAHDTGWRVALHPEPHQGVLQARAREVLPIGLTALGTPALQHAQRTVLVRCRGEAASGDIAAAEATFEETTGWRLAVQSVR
jgi:hypothetical protein